MYTAPFLLTISFQELTYRPYLFTRRGLILVGGQKIARGLQAKFHMVGNPTTRDNLMRGYYQRVGKKLARVGGLNLP